MKLSQINCNGKLLSLEKPVVMGILNVTPDSFFDGGNYTFLEKAIQQAEKMITDGAAIIDIGGQSTRPGATECSEAEELNRVIPVIETIHKKFPAQIISIDTYRAKVAEAAIEKGAAIINDVSGGTIDENMFATAARLQVPYILMHIQGTPATMQQQPHYDDVVLDVYDFLSKKIYELKQAGVKDIIVDVGFGFGKTTAHNYQLLNYFENFNLLNCPILAGVSRKGMIYKTLQTTADKTLNGTTVLNTIALMKGASILRVHDVKEALEAIELLEQLKLT